MPRNPSIGARDRGLALISRINRWMIAGAVGLTGLISLIASQSFHGRTLTSRPVSAGSSSAGSSASSASGGTSQGSGSASAIQQPAQSPSPAPAPVTPSAPVVSGGS